MKDSLFGFYGYKAGQDLAISSHLQHKINLRLQKAQADYRYQVNHKEDLRALYAYSCQPHLLLRNF